MLEDEELKCRSRWIAFRLITTLHVAFLLDGATAQTTIDQIAPSSSESTPRSDPSKIAIAIVLLCLFFFIGFLSIFIRHCSGCDSSFEGRSLPRASDCSRRDGLDVAIVETFPVFPYSSVKDIKIGSGTLECAVCLGEFEENATLRLLPRCSHVFHVDCIDPWLYSHITCPVCRVRLTPESVKLGEHEHAGIDSSVEPGGLVNTEYPVDQTRDQVTIVVADDRIGGSEMSGADLKRDERKRSGKLPEKCTLRLLEEMREQMMAAEDSSTRDSGGESSSRGTGNAVGSGGSSNRVRWTDRWGLFVSRMGAVR